jgi:hypothetical protein
MLEGGEVDLAGTLDVYLIEWDGVMSFPGYSVSIIPGLDNYARLVKTE